MFPKMFPKWCLENWGTKFCCPNMFGELGNEMLFPKMCLVNKGTRFCSPKHIWGTRERDSVPQNTFGEQGNEILFPKYIWGIRERDSVPQTYLGNMGNETCSPNIPDCSREHITLTQPNPWIFSCDLKCRFFKLWGAQNGRFNMLKSIFCIRLGGCEILVS